MKKTLALLKRLYKKHSEERALRAYDEEVREAVKRKNEVMYWLLDIARFGPMIK